MEYNEHSYAAQLNNLDEIDNSQKETNYSTDSRRNRKLTKEEIENLNRHDEQRIH